LKLRYSDFTTITRARTLTSATDLDTEIHSAVRALFTLHAKPGAAVRLLGVHAAGWDTGSEQMELLDAPQSEKWRRTLAAVDRLRDRFGESAVSLAAGMRGGFRERVHENHSGPPGKGANPKVG
jgi:DNA polymerase IV